jgi:predicted HD phosphohydrolase
MPEHADLADILLSLRGVWDEVDVDELDHALQSAARAMDDGADDELVLAAALHDIAHSPLMPAGPAHDQLAREWLTPRYGERVGWLAGAHVAAKRHLAATVPGYQLSVTSQQSLQRQGGAAVDPAFTGHPWWPDALRLRHYDDAAKEPGAAGATVGQVLEVARRVRVTRDPDADGAR